MATHSSILAWRIPMDRGACWATVHGVTKSQTRLKQLSMHSCSNLACMHAAIKNKCQCWRAKRHWFDCCVGTIPWRRKWQPTPVFLPGKSYGQRSLAGYSPWGRKELDTTEATYHSTNYTYMEECESILKLQAKIKQDKARPDGIYSLNFINKNQA